MHRFASVFVLLCATAVLSALLWAGAAVAETVAGNGRSPIVLNGDGAGTTVVKDLGDSSFQVQQLWATNQVNGIQSFMDGSFAFVNCNPTRRTVEEIDLSCSVFDPALDGWGPPVETTVPLDFLDGPYENPFNALFEWTGEYLTSFEIGGESYSFRMRFVDGVETPDGFPVLLGQTAPESRALMLRNVDVPGGTTERTNASIAMQYDDTCFDFDVSPVEPGGVLAGTVGARRLQADGSCGEVIEEGRPVALVPSGAEPEAGAVCPYLLVDFAECLPVAPPPEAVLCLPCTGECRELSGPQDVVVAVAFVPYVLCRDVVLEARGGACERECDGARAVIAIGPPGPGGAAAALAVR